MNDWLLYWRHFWTEAEGDPQNVKGDWHTNQGRFFEQVQKGDSLWVVVTGGPESDEWRLLERIVVRAKRRRRGEEREFLISGDRKQSERYDIAVQADATSLLKKLNFVTGKKITEDARLIGRSLQTIRPLTPQDGLLLKSYRSQFFPAAQAALNPKLQPEAESSGSADGDSHILFLNNCWNRDHVALFGSGAFYDLDATGFQSTKATDLYVGQECIVATTANAERIAFRWYAFQREVEMTDKDGKGCRVFFGSFIKEDTLTKADAILDARYSPFFDVNGNFKRQSVINGQRSPSWLRADEADQTATVAGDEYIPNDADRRRLIARQIRERRGQQQFRNALRKRYGDRCLVTGCTLLEVLEAAHVSPYRGEEDNDPRNGLLLRSDIHTLFDLELLGVEPDTLKVELHPCVLKEYGKLDRCALRCPKNCRPSCDALKLRYEHFKRRL